LKAIFKNVLMLTKEESLKFFAMLGSINTYGADYTTLDIPYDNNAPIAKGAKVIKTKEDARGDRHKVGATGITIGAIEVKEVNDFGYIVVWDNTPKTDPAQPYLTNANITFCVGIKISDKL
jgi:hypothetical protein